MKIYNINNLEKFFQTVDSCKGRVELVTGEGDRLNLKSTLTQYVAFTKVFSKGIVPELELVIYDIEDVYKFMDFMLNDKEEENK